MGDKEKYRGLALSLGKRLKRAREEKGLTRAVASKRTKVNEKTLQRIEEGNASLRLETLLNIAQYFKVDISNTIFSYQNGHSLDHGDDESEEDENSFLNKIIDSQK